MTRRALLRGLGAAGLTSAGAMAGGGIVGYRDRATTRLRADAAATVEPRRADSLRVLWRATTTENVVALTFDDGPVERYTRPLLDVLEEARVPATFCVVGSRAAEQRDLLTREVSGRHELVNHTWDHPDLCLLGAAAVADELDRTDEVIRAATGRSPRLVRPPYGRVSGAVLEAAAERDLDVLMWDVRLHEKAGDGAADPDDVAQEVLDLLHPGMVLLGHDGGPGPHHVGVAALPRVLREGQARGYRFVTASELFALT
jgi:peptidoglycan/xylan/chitin deacetylase (PgdA/CDA1 family)